MTDRSENDEKMDKTYIKTEYKLGFYRLKAQKVSFFGMCVENRSEC